MVKRTDTGFRSSKEKGYAAGGSRKIGRSATTGEFVARKAAKGVAKKSTKGAPLSKTGAPTRMFRASSAADVPVRSDHPRGGVTAKRVVQAVLDKIQRETRIAQDNVKREAAEHPVVVVATHPPVHPGEIIREEFMEPMGLTAYAIAKACHMQRSKLERIVRGELGISGDTAVRLGRFFGNSAQFWMNLQATYEVLKASQELGDAVKEIEPFNYEVA